MENGSAKYAFPPREDVENYFAMKIFEAKLEGDTKYVKFLEASWRTWDENSTMHVQLARNIVTWHNEVQQMNALIAWQEDGLLRRTCKHLANGPSTGRTEAAATLAVMTAALALTTRAGIGHGLLTALLCVAVFGTIWSVSAWRFYQTLTRRNPQ